MATSSLISTQHAAASISLARSHPAASSTASTGSSASSDDGATITANDFLTLLVTEMQNQDPTADTDPNEYIDQLVNVNSLEQLIQINQTLSTALPAPSSGTGARPTWSTASAAPSAMRHRAPPLHPRNRLRRRPRRRRSHSPARRPR